MKETGEDIKIISYKEAIDFLLPRHYSGRKPNIKYAFGLFILDKLSAVCTFGKPASNSLCVGVAGKDWSKHVYELNRLCTNGIPISGNLSHFVSSCLRELKKYNLIIVSYADKQMGHVGYIYQACNFIYTGSTLARTDKYVEGNKHSRHYDKDSKTNLRKLRSSKHRYIYFSGAKRVRKRFLKDLKYPVMDYPKDGESKKYILGDFINPVVLKNGFVYIDAIADQLEFNFE